MSGCNGDCLKYKAQKPPRVSRYAVGQKSCNYCGVFLEYAGFSCPCCNKQLRCVPRSKKGKEKYISQIISQI